MRRTTVGAVITICLCWSTTSMQAAEPARDKPLPWADDLAADTQGTLTVRVATQTVLDRTRDFTGFRFEVENTGESPVELEALSLELLSARQTLADRDPKVTRLPIRGCWYQNESQFHTVRKNGRVSGPVTIQVPPRSSIRLMLQFEPVRRSARSHWRRLTFSVGGLRTRVTGPITTIRFSEDSIEGELR